MANNNRHPNDSLVEKFSGPRIIYCLRGIIRLLVNVVFLLFQDQVKLAALKHDILIS